jgi:PAS domain S-box-containing protein
MPRSLTDLAGLNVPAEDFLAAVLDTAAQPIWVVDPSDVIRFANPAALAALGYDDASELLHRRSHDTIHHTRPDGSPFPAEECRLLLPRLTGERVTSELDWFFRRDGSVFPVSYVSVPIEMPEGRGAVVAFNDIEERLRSERLLRERDELLEAQQASLRRVAGLVAGGAASAEVFAAIAREAGQVLGLATVEIWRHEPDGTTTALGVWNDHPRDLEATGGSSTAATAPIVVDGRLWGLMAAAAAGGELLPDNVQSRLADFTELVATAISNAQARAELGALGDEQAALRRVATLVARGVLPDEVWAAIAQEVQNLFSPDAGTGLLRVEPDGSVTLVGVKSPLAIEVGNSFVPEEGAAALAIESGRPARLDRKHPDGPAPYSEPPEFGSTAWRRLFRTQVATPIEVEGRVWGVAVTSWIQQPPPPGIEARVAEFTDLLATALANADSRAELAASRARLVEAADAERRRVVRDLHDGAQQRLVHTVVTLKLARRALEQGDEAAPALVEEALNHAGQANVELRELAHGILPAVLSSGGLRAGVEALASRMPVPVELGVSVGRLPPAAEATAYFVLAEALTNVAKHSGAGCAAVTVREEDDTLRVRVRDDGVGGARVEGSGLQGLADRVAALDGRLDIESPPGGGTLVAADIPVGG